MKKIIISIIMMCELMNVVYAKSAGHTQADFLKIGIGARAAAMGEAYSSIADTVEGLYWNPGGLGQIEQRQVSFSHYNYVAAIEYNQGSYAQKFLGGVVGVGVNMLKTDDIKRDNDGNSIGRFSDANNMLIVGYSREYKEGMYVGSAIKGIQLQYDNVSAQGFGVDAGVLKKVGEKMNVAAVVQNLGPKMGFENDDKVCLPILIRLGLSCQYVTHGLAAVDMMIPYEGESIMSVGTEYVVMDMFAIRGGYKRRERGNDLGDADGISLGVGFTFKGYTIDYAYVPFGDFENTHRVSVVVSF